MYSVANVDVAKPLPLLETTFCAQQIKSNEKVIDILPQLSIFFLFFLFLVKVEMITMKLDSFWLKLKHGR